MSKWMFLISFFPLALVSECQAQSEDTRHAIFELNPFNNQFTDPVLLEKAVNSYWIGLARREIQNISQGRREGFASPRELTNKLVKLEAALEPLFALEFRRPC